MPARYASGGVSFLYPDNWSVAQDEPHRMPRTVTVEAPGGAFWSVDIHPFSVDPDELLQQVLQALCQEYVDLECQEVTEHVGMEIASGRDIHFSCLDFVVRAQLRSLRHGHATYLLTYQAEDRDFSTLEQVFRAISHSLFQNVPDE